MSMTYAQKKLLILSSLGGLLEFYDFIIYALFASYFSSAFFPAQSHMTSLIATFAAFSVGYLVRPLGGIIMGHFGDRYGRKITFSVSILMMAVATFCIALLPTYNHVGIMAPIALIALRVIQGISVGGEIPGSISYVSESISARKGLACGFVFCSLISGIVLGSLVHAIMLSFLSQAQMLSWGWRLAFILGGLFGFFSYLMRRELEESTLFQSIRQQRVKLPLFELFNKRAVNALAAIFVVGLGACIITLVFLFTPAYLTKVLHLQIRYFIWYKTLAIFISAVLALLFGWYSDHTKYSKKSLLGLLGISSMVFIYLIFRIYVYHQNLFLVALMLSAVLNGFAWGIIPSYLAELFPTQVRYTGIAFSYNIGFALFCGLTPLVSLLLIAKLKWMMAPILFLMAIAAVMLLSLTFLRQSALDEG
jgi:MFS family permease